MSDEYIEEDSMNMLINVQGEVLELEDVVQNEEQFICVEEIEENSNEEHEDDYTKREKIHEKEVETNKDFVVYMHKDVGEEQQWQALYDIPNEEVLKSENVVEEDTLEYMLGTSENTIEEVIYNEHYLEQQQEVEMDRAQIQALLEQQEIQSLKDDIKNEVDENNRYFCCECQTIFADLESAEQHDCPALNDCNSQDTMPEEDEPQEEYEISRDAEVLESNFICAVCGRAFDSIKALGSHSRVHKTKNVEEIPVPLQESVVCDVCKTTFSSQKYLKLHMKIHQKRALKSIHDVLVAGAKAQYNELNQFFCEICNKNFDESLLGIHKNMHQNVEEFNCSVCNRQLENLHSYEMHMKMHDETRSQRPKRIIISKAKTRRLAGETGKRTHPCQYCGHEFSRPHEKVKHERVHTGEKPYECEVCGKTFRVSYSLTLHLRTHTDMRPYVCPTCNKRYKSHSVYAHHLKTHLDERAYKCDSCEKTFRTAVQLASHKNSHTKPFNCPECNRPFATLYAVKLHMKTHSKLNPSSEFLKHKCNFCGAVYARVFALQTHLQKDHSDEAQTMDDTILEEDPLSAETEEVDCGAFMEAIEEVGAIITNDEKYAHDFQTEEVIADWLTNT